MQCEDNESQSSNGPLSHGSSTTSSTKCNEADRIKTFEHYPLPHFVNVLRLAKCGFIYEQDQQSESKMVTCVGCNKSVESWKAGDDPSSPQFHESGCRYLADEHLTRATVPSEEATKPLETSYPMQEESYEVMSPEIVRETQSLLPSKKKENPDPRMYRESSSLPPLQTYEVTQIRRTDEKRGSTVNVSRHVVSRQTSTPQPQDRGSFVSQPESNISEHSIQPQSSIIPSGFFQRQSSYHERNLANMPSTSYQTPPISLQSRLEEPLTAEDMSIQLDMRNAQNRLRTFELFWSVQNEFRNYRLLVVCGFYCLGQGDAVECFCCHVVAANWTRNDNPRQRHMDMSPHCRFIRGHDAGDVPLAPEARRVLPLPTPMQHHPSLPTQPSTRTSSPYQSLGHNPISQPSLEGATTSREVLMQPTNTMIERTNLMIEFPCLNPANPSMREERVRLATFDRNLAFRQNTRLQASNQALAEAGLYYLGDGDRTKCWFCDGGLKDFQPTDDPWTEHAKYFPECEFLLQQRGPAFVTSVSVLFPNIQRPLLPARSGNVLPNVVSSPHPLPPPPAPIEDPQQLLHQREQMLETGMALPHVQTAREMGFTEEQIRDVMMRKILRSNCCYQSSEALVEALINPNAEQSEESSSQASGENLIDISGQTITIRGGNFIGPSVINGRIYDPSQQQQPPHGDGNIFADVTRSTRRRRNHTSIIINGQPMEDFFNDAFNNDFFNNTTHFMQTHATAPTPSTPRTYDQNHNGVQLRGVRQLHRMAQPPLPAYFNNTPSQSSAGTSGTTTTSTTPVEGATGGSLPGASNVTPGSAEERVEEMERERRCKVCYTETADILFQPCGHICACAGCSQRLSACPVCRRRIARYIRTYHA